MRIEAVVVCKNYSDFLAHSLPENMQQLDQMVVVTHPDDNDTKKLCNRFGIDFVETKIFHENDDKFNKGRAINLGLSHLRNNGWVLHMDSDIVLPHRFRDMVSRAKLNPKHIYGADRLNTKSHENWEKHKHKRVPQYHWRYMVNAQEEFSLGARLVHAEYGYCPIGYFQLWHSTVNRKYPVHAGSAEHSDVLFAVQWAREERILLPELFVYHLESEGDAPMGINWDGRKTKHFKGHKSCACHDHNRCLCPYKPK